MIARTWHGMVPEARGDEYAAYLAKTGIPDYRSTPGNLGVHVLRRTEGDRTHFLLVTFWDSWASIRARALPGGATASSRSTTTTSAP